MYACIASIPFFLWGYFSINAGLTSEHAGPIIGGVFSCIIGCLFLIIGLLIIIDNILNGRRYRRIERRMKNKDH